MQEIVSNCHNEAIRILLKNIRVSKRLSQNQVYLESGVEISKYESTHCTPSTSSIIKLCDFYGVSFVGFWIICEEYFKEQLSLSNSINILLNWSKYEQIYQTLISLITKKNGGLL